MMKRNMVVSVFSAMVATNAFAVNSGDIPESVSSYVAQPQDNMMRYEAPAIAVSAPMPQLHIPASTPAPAIEPLPQETVNTPPAIATQPVAATIAAPALPEMVTPPAVVPATVVAPPPQIMASAAPVVAESQPQSTAYDTVLPPTLPLSEQPMLMAAATPVEGSPALASAAAALPVTSDAPATVTPADNKAELQAKVSFYQTPDFNVQGGAGYNLDTTLYTPTFNTNWRLFAGEYYAHENEPEGEGNITLWRSQAGVEYSNSGFRLSLAPTYNHYNDANRVGGTGETSWTINDQWAIGAGGQIFSVDTPLRALNSGLTANSYTANAQWHQGEQRSMLVDAEVMTYSDDNLRGSINGLYNERLYTGSAFTVDGVVNMTESQGSLNEDRLYYNPKADFLGQGGLKMTEVLYRDGDKVYQQSLQLLPGDYWQRSYSGSFAFDARYELRARLSSTLEAGIGGDFSHQAADGVENNSITALVDLTERFW